MDNLSEAFSYTGHVLTNSIQLWATYLSFWVLALIVRKTQDKTRRRCGNVMLVSSIPGLIISLVCIGTFIYSFAVILSGLQGGALCASSVDEGRKIMDLCNGLPVSCIFFSLFIRPVLGIISIVCGVKINGNGSGKIIGPVAIIYGAGLIIADIFLTYVFFLFLSA